MTVSSIRRDAASRAPAAFGFPAHTRRDLQPERLSSLTPAAPAGVDAALPNRYRAAGRFLGSSKSFGESEEPTDGLGQTERHPAGTNMVIPKRQPNSVLATASSGPAAQHTLPVAAIDADGDRSVPSGTAPHATPKSRDARNGTPCTRWSPGTPTLSPGYRPCSSVDSSGGYPRVDLNGYVRQAAVGHEQAHACTPASTPSNQRTVPPRLRPATRWPTARNSCNCSGGAVR